MKPEQFTVYRTTVESSTQQAHDNGIAAERGETGFVNKIEMTNGIYSRRNPLCAREGGEGKRSTNAVTAVTWSRCEIKPRTPCEQYYSENPTEVANAEIKIKPGQGRYCKVS